jgi:hypothetical protein
VADLTGQEREHVGRERTGATPRPLRVLLLLGTSGGGVGRHVRALAASLVDVGVAVHVAAPAAVGAEFDFVGAGATFTAVGPLLAGSRAVLTRVLAVALAAAVLGRLATDRVTLDGALGAVLSGVLGSGVTAAVLGVALWLTDRDDLRGLLHRGDVTRGDVTRGDVTRGEGTPGEVTRG